MRKKSRQNIINKLKGKFILYKMELFQKCKELFQSFKEKVNYLCSGFFTMVMVSIIPLLYETDKEILGGNKTLFEKIYVYITFPILFVCSLAYCLIALVAVIAALPFYLLSLGIVFFY